ncbi:MAG: insulinase family protein [Planctomycetes bacterium]|nr:insulinase family protein [Planctomycetota bacterium]MBI3833500.1 insulinase family protein [Planctomycetota bacterium]
MSPATSATSPFTVHTLKNGLSVVIEEMPDVCSVAAGFLCRTGARDETPPLAGVSHFLEHMMFKGTSRRTWAQITIDFDSMGSAYNAFTSEDRTIYYGWVRTKDLEPQIELLADMMRSAIPLDEFTTEKNVILEEIAMSKDNLDHVAFDFLQEKVFAGHPLAWPILGYDSTVQSLTRDQMWDYFQQRYAPNNMLLVVAGALKPEQVIEVAERYCGSWPRVTDPPKRVPPKVARGVDVLKLDRFNQQVIALTFPSVSACDSRIEVVSAAATILGGENSRMYWDIVQKGIAPRAGAHHLDFTDSGVLILYGSCDPTNAELLLDALRKEARRLTDEPPRDAEVDRVKNRRRTSVAVEAEAPYYRLTQLMDDMEFHGRPRTVDEALAEVDAVTSDSIVKFLREFPIDGEGHLTSVGPRDWPKL